MEKLKDLRWNYEKWISLGISAARLAVAGGAVD
jgi:hypothetical protein